MRIGKKICKLLSVGLLLSSITINASALGMNDVNILKGSNRYETASMIAGNMGEYDSVILVNADNNNLSDGLSASGLAGVIKAPILLVHKNSIPNQTQLRIDIAKNIYIIGSENSISKGLEEKLADKNRGDFNVKRIGGNNRFETSANVAKEILKIKGGIGKVFITNGYKGSADAMSISAVAARDGEPVILTNGKNLDRESLRIVEQTRNIYAVGGSNNISTHMISNLGAYRIAGNNRYETNADVIKTFYKDMPTRYYLSDGYKLVDALTGSPLAGKYISPIVLVGPNSDKSMLKDAKDLVALGGIPKIVLEKCVAATR